MLESSVASESSFRRMTISSPAAARIQKAQASPRKTSSVPAVSTAFENRPDRLTSKTKA